MAQIRDKKFEKQLKKYLKVVDKEGTKGIRELSLEGLSLLITQSPVDEGVFRGNWNVGINNINLSIDETRRASEAESEGKSVAGSIKTGDSINLSNALPYAMRLEYGWSSQAPNGVVRMTLKELKNWLRKQNKKV